MGIPETMRVAVYTRPGEIAVEERLVPDVADHDVLLEVSHCGICGSDIHFVLEGWGHPGSIEGHEFSGRVVAVGSAVSHWKVGDEVVGGPSQRCGECEFCLAGRPSLCIGRGAAGEGPGADGAFAEYIRVTEDALLRLPEGLGLREAALAEPLAVALHGLTRGDVHAGQRILITGAGPIGALSAAAARMRGVTDIVVSEPHAERRALIERLGVVAIDPSELTPPPSPNYVVDEPFDVALECSGNAAAMELALSQLRRAGTLVFVGAGMKSPRLDGNRILLNELTITGSFIYDADGFERALEMLSDPAFPASELIEADEVPLDGLLDALRGLVDGELAAKVMIVPRLAAREGSDR